MPKSHWSISKRLSPALAEIMLELLRKACPGQIHSTETPSATGVVIENIVGHATRRKRGWTSRRLKPVDLALNNALAKPLRLGRRWLIVPPEYGIESSRNILRMEAGMGFGSGSHETTQLCLRLMENITAARGSFLDCGTGSGILAIAAARLGFDKILGLDCDAKALRSARRNASWNEMAKKIQWQRANLTRWNSSRRFDVVAANLLSKLLLSQKEKIVARIRPKGFLILSGLLNKECPDVQSHYESAGLKTIRLLRKGRWTALLLRAPH